MNLTEMCRVAKESVSARQAADALGLAPNRYGKCVCPFHRDRHPSMKVYDEIGKGFYCFTCKTGGDVVDLVMGVTGLPLRGAVKWLDGAFSLGMADDSPDRQEALRRAREAAEKRDAERRKKERFRDRVFDRQLDVLTMTLAAEEVMDQTRPRKYSDGFSDEFCAALAARESLRWIREDLDVMLWEG